MRTGKAPDELIEQLIIEAAAYFAQTSGRGSILFIDEAHTLIGAGATGSSPQNAADILKPVLARGQLQCIAATTMEEYFQYFSRDAALERRFEVLEVEVGAGTQLCDQCIGS